MELFEEIRREHEFGVGTIQGAARKLGVHRRMVRQALGDACLGEGVEDSNDLTQRPTEPGEFANDQTVAALEDVYQFVGRRRFSEACPEAVASMKLSMRKSCLRAYSRMARR